MVVRRSYLTQPKESLLLPRSAMAVLERFAQASDDTGLPEEQLLMNSLTSFPVFVKDPESGPRGWPVNTNPGMMWHPWFWLTDRVSGRYEFNDEDGVFVRELDDFWITRVAFETIAAELYDPESGSWLDVLSLYGLDIALPDVQARVAAWLSGADDPVLDSIDLTEQLEDPDQPDWAAAEVNEFLRAGKAASWGAVAESILLTLNESFPKSKSVEEARHVLQTIADAAAILVGDAPTDDGHDRLDTFYQIAEEAQDPAVPFEQVHSRVQYIVNSLTEVRNGFYPIYEEFVSQLQQDASE